MSIRSGTIKYIFRAKDSMSAYFSRKSQSNYLVPHYDGSLIALENSLFNRNRIDYSVPIYRKYPLCRIVNAISRTQDPNYLRWPI